MNNTTCPQTLIEAVRYFSDLDLCHSYMARIKWPDGKITCPECGADNIGTIKGRPASIGSNGKKKRARQPMLQCKNAKCRKQFSSKVGTIFEDSPLSLDKWFVAVWCITNAKNGISSCELARALGITQKSAWFVLHRVRLAMQTGTFEKFRGEVEADETFMGGLARNMHKSKREERITGAGPVGKSVVMGLLQRHGKVKAKVVKDTKRGSVQTEVRKHVEPGSEVFTDSLQSYSGLSPDYVHQVINHAEAYAKGKVHTNGLENFWSLLKRMIKGTYVHVAPFHLFRYLDEESTRFNERHGNDAERFLTVLSRIAGKRLTYKKLIGTEIAPAAGA